MQTSRFTNPALSTRAPFAQVNRPPVPMTGAIPHKSKRHRGSENQRPAAPAPAHSYATPIQESNDQRAMYDHEREQEAQEVDRIRSIGRIILRFYAPFDDLTNLLRLAASINSPHPPKLRPAERRLAELGGRILAAFDDLPALINKRGVKDVGDIVRPHLSPARVVLISS
ncbi:hypothetical protein EXIGLDRAFT_383161 [Exidia glandulosa HHB12029]|uniref:Uncharacterized protein n=1 Tax=Exidia glandulosa HHB12029 TaxID=1314781 RepID=A0A165L2F4_EXIGL|nr:hypothetical protein EXIGLDRAFT_383161 [Exidia glandulosa HHB12029]